MTGQTLKDIRQELGLTQQELAERVGYTVKAIQNYEAERQPITKALELHVLDLMTLHRIKKIIDP